MFSELLNLDPRFCDDLTYLVDSLGFPEMPLQAALVLGILGRPTAGKLHGVKIFYHFELLQISVQSSNAATASHAAAFPDLTAWPIALSTS